jgi:glucuronokinase
MDLSVDRFREGGRGFYERLPEDCLPPFYVAWDPTLGAGSETVHNALRERLARGDPGAEGILGELASLADEARGVLLSRRPLELAGIVDRNFDLRAKLVDVGEGNRRLVETGRRLGAGVKQTGSGGAVVGVHDGDPDRVSRLKDAYSRIGARFLQPAVWTAPMYETSGSAMEPREPEAPQDPEAGYVDGA